MKMKMHLITYWKLVIVTFHVRNSQKLMVTAKLINMSMVYKTLSQGKYFQEGI